MTCFHDKECGDEILLCAKDGNKKVGGQLQHITRAGKQNPFRFPAQSLRCLETSDLCPPRGTCTPQVHVGADRHGHCIGAEQIPHAEDVHIGRYCLSDKGG